MLNWNSSRLYIVGITLLYLPIAWYYQWEYYYPALLLIPFLLLVFIGVTNIQMNFFIKAECKGNTDKKEIAITFDDGPHPVVTPKILDVLKKHNVHATFFCIGKNIDENLSIAERIHNEGHKMGNHTYNHSFWFDIYSSKKVIDEISKTSKSIKNVVKAWPNFFRPPYGITNPNIKRAIVGLRDIRVIGWSVRSLDTKFNDINKILDRVKNVSPGDVVLFHDTQEHTIEVLEQFLHLLNEKGYKVVSLEKLIGLNAYD